jgi:hypothetical protein
MIPRKAPPGALAMAAIVSSIAYCIGDVLLSLMEDLEHRVD